MLKELTINNFATIENLTVEFGEGLNVLTGETGAGKSIIIDALNLALGGRSDTDSIRTGKETATIEALFDIESPETIRRVENLGIELGEGTLIVKRTLSLSGKNRTYLNGSSVTVGALSELGDRLVDIHGQHAHQTLLHPELHVDLLDAHGGLLEERSCFEKEFSGYRRAIEELKRLQSNERDRLQKEDLLRFQLKEIDSANLSEDEEEQLKNQKHRLANAEKIRNGLEKTIALLSDNEGSAIEILGISNQELGELEGYDGELRSTAEKARTLFYEMEDLVSTLRDYVHSKEFNPDQLEEIEGRLSEINRLKRKYDNDSLAEVLEYRNIVEKELAALSGNQERVDALQAELVQREKTLGQHASMLAEKREDTAEILGKKAARELKDLNMNKARLDARFIYDPGGFVPFRGDRVKASPQGIGTVEFLFTANPGEEPRPLAKIASGGELARVMLALKTILNEQDTIPSLVFDEVDIGVGGSVAEKIGRKLKALSTNKQVFCVTHLPQIAGIGSSHFLIEKKTNGKRTCTVIRKLTNEERVDEIARMSGGAKITDATRKHAREMLKI